MQAKGKGESGMFFSGDPTARKRVDLGGRSSKERDRQVLLEQTREERRRRLGLRLQHSSATKLQVCSRLPARGERWFWGVVRRGGVARFSGVFSSAWGLELSCGLLQWRRSGIICL